MLEENFWERNCSGGRDPFNNTYLEIVMIEGIKLRDYLLYSRVKFPQYSLSIIFIF